VIAFVTGSSLGTIHPDGTHRRRLRGDHSDFGVAWSPGGRRIAYTHGTVPGPGGDLETALDVAGSSGSDPLRILGNSVDPGTPGGLPTAG
jgi:hypothetical protein